MGRLAIQPHRFAGKNSMLFLFEIIFADTMQNDRLCIKYWD